MEKKSEDVSWIWKLPFLKKASIGAIITIVIIYLITLPVIITPLYESEVIVYVPLAILSQQLNQQGIGFASEKEIDWYIQILKSNHLRDSLIARFNLMSEFKVDTNKFGMKSRVLKMLDSRIDIEKTRYASVSIKVRDNSPKRAAAMANEILELGEIIKKNMLYQNRLESMHYVQSLFEQKSNELSSLEKQLDSVSKSKSTNQSSKNFLYEKTLRLYNHGLEELIFRKDLFEREERNFNTPLPKVYVISTAEPESKPIWPKRGIMCVVGAGTYLLLLLIIEIIKRDSQK